MQTVTIEVIVTHTLNFKQFCNLPYGSLKILCYTDSPKAKFANTAGVGPQHRSTCTNHARLDPKHLDDLSYNSSLTMYAYAILFSP